MFGFHRSAHVQYIECIMSEAIFVWKLLRLRKSARFYSAGGEKTLLRLLAMCAIFRNDRRLNRNCRFARGGPERNFTKSAVNGGSATHRLLAIGHGPYSKIMRDLVTASRDHFVNCPAHGRRPLVGCGAGREWNFPLNYCYCRSAAPLSQHNESNYFYCVSHSLTRKPLCISLRASRIFPTREQTETNGPRDNSARALEIASDALSSQLSWLSTALFENSRRAVLY